jgi:hypothetical protein
MRNPTAQTEPLTAGQRIVAAYEADMIAEPCELATLIDNAIELEREACAKIAIAVGYPEWDNDTPGYHQGAWEQCANRIATKIRSQPT